MVIQQPDGFALETTSQITTETNANAEMRR